MPDLDENLLAELLAHLPVDLGIRLAAEIDRLAAAPGTHDIAAEALSGRAARLARRDEAARSLAQLVAPGAPRTTAARATSAALTRYLASGWRGDRRDGVPAGASPVRRALFDLATWNAGRSIAWRQLADLLDGHRGPLSPKVAKGWALQSISEEVATLTDDDGEERNSDGNENSRDTRPA